MQAGASRPKRRVGNEREYADHGQRKRWASCAVPSPGGARCPSRLVISLAPPKEHGSKTSCGPSRRRIGSMPGRLPHSRPPGHESVTRPAALPSDPDPGPDTIHAPNGRHCFLHDLCMCSRPKETLLFGARDEELTTRRGKHLHKNHTQRTRDR